MMPVRSGNTSVFDRECPTQTSPPHPLSLQGVMP